MVNICKYILQIIIILLYIIFYKTIIRQPLLTALHFFNEFYDSGPVVPLGDNAGKIDAQCVEEHEKHDFARSEKSEHPKRENGKPMRHFGTAGFGQKLVHAVFRERIHRFFLIAAFHDRAAIRQEFFPSVHFENRFINRPVLFPRVRPIKKEKRRKAGIGQFETDQCRRNLQDRPENKAQRDGRPFR